MIDTKRFAAAALALVFSLMVFVVPAGATKVNSYDFTVIPAVGIDFSQAFNAAGSRYFTSSPDAVATLASYPGSGDLYQLSIFTKDPTITVYRYSNQGIVSDTYSSWSLISPGSDLYFSTSAQYALDSTYVPAFSSFEDACSGASSFLDSAATSDPAAELVDAADSFAFGTGYSINNTSDIDIAVATYNLGYNDIIVACSYETLVLPGTIAGMNGNYNINVSAREYHIPVRYTTVVSDGTFSSLSPFESLEDAVSACYSILQDSPNHGGGYTPTVTSFTLQPGNVAYIEMADLTQSIDLGATFSEYSALFQTAGSYFPGNTLYKSGVDYPQEGDVLPGATANQIPWQKNEWGEENLLGQTKVGFASITASSNLVMIYNPYYRGDDSSTVTNPKNINPAIHITSSGIARNGIRVYSLKDSFSAVNGNYYYGIGSTSPTGFGDYSQSQNNPNAEDPSITGWTDQDGNPTTAPGVTPYNSPPENESLSDVLTGFFNNITGIFTEGHDAIKNLVESSSEFTSRLSALYTWLPPQVYSVLISAIILAIIVGVLKVFL